MQTSGPYANAADFSGIISQALITTATGLALAIMAYLAHHFLLGRVRALVHDMEWVGNDMLQFLLVDLPATPAPLENADLPLPGEHLPLSSDENPQPTG
jgi:biopolymer transport protein ExbB